MNDIYPVFLCPKCFKKFKKLAWFNEKEMIAACDNCQWLFTVKHTAYNYRLRHHEKKDKKTYYKIPELRQGAK